MNKKYIAFSFVALLALTLVSAGLVNYLSNTRQTNIDVKSPILIDAFDGNATAFGGEMKTISTHLANLANAQIQGKIKVVITNDNISINDFETLTVSIDEFRPSFPSGERHNVMTDLDMITEGAGLVESIDDNGDNIVIISTVRTFEIGETWDADIALGFKANADGNYNVAVTVIPLD